MMKRLPVLVAMLLGLSLAPLATACDDEEVEEIEVEESTGGESEVEEDLEEAGDEVEEGLDEAEDEVDEEF